ncbi:hypothetical protein ILUMI_26175 [Ignelater luminosus]|uniref:Transposase n=1 Tax=Ignelater luminosus TaxID=2038154 RepID=A0A8K0FXH1_IGNLU|nr:hypothetical protein ILUMI_26175 [Ignelater luminosus]
MKPFEVAELKTSDFLELSALFKTTFQERKTNTEGDKVVWRDIKWLRFSQQSGLVQYKTKLDTEEPFKSVMFLRKGSTWPSKIKVPQFYKRPIPISSVKKQNLLELLPKIPEKGIMLHHDNAPSYTTNVTLQFVAKKKKKVIKHPPYSSDLKICEFRQCFALKGNVRGRKFLSEEEINAAEHDYFASIPKEEWFLRSEKMVKCIIVEGNYSEHI